MPATLQVIVNAPTHLLAKPEHAAMRHRNGDVIDLIPTAELADLIGSEYKIRGEIRNPRFSFIHISDFPDEQFERARRRITEMITAASDKLRLSRYRVLFSALPAPVRTALRDDREITMTWAQAKSVIRKKIITVILDPQQDDESTSIVDADLL